MVQLWYNFRLLRFNLSFIYIETMEHPLVNIILILNIETIDFLTLLVLQFESVEFTTC